MRRCHTTYKLYIVLQWNIRLLYGPIFVALCGDLWNMATHILKSWIITCHQALKRFKCQLFISDFVPQSEDINKFTDVNI